MITKEKLFAIAITDAAINMLYAFRLISQEYVCEYLGDLLHKVAWASITPGSSPIGNEDILDAVLAYAGVDLVEENEEGDLPDYDCYKIENVDESIYNKVVATVMYYKCADAKCPEDYKQISKEATEYVNNKLHRISQQVI